MSNLDRYKAALRYVARHEQRADLPSEQWWLERDRLMAHADRLAEQCRGRR